MAELGKYCDSLITIPNQKLLTVLGPQTTLLDAFKAANQVLQGAVQGIAELITRPGLINARPSMVIGVLLVRTLMGELWILPTCFGSEGLRVRARKQPRLFP